MRMRVKGAITLSQLYPVLSALESCHKTHIHTHKHTRSDSKVSQFIQKDESIYISDSHVP